LVVAVYGKVIGDLGIIFSVTQQ